MLAALIPLEVLKSGPFHYMSNLGVRGGVQCNYKTTNLIKFGFYVIGYTNYYICIKFENSSVNNDLRNAKKVHITN